MFKRFAALIALSLALPAMAGQPITGRWLTTDGSAVVAIGDCGGSLCGRIVRVLKGPPGRAPVDANNPNAAFKTRPLVGVAVLSGLTPDGDGWKGKIYDPKTGKTYSAVVTRAGSKLNVKGCAGPFCRTSVWSAAG